MAVNPPQTSPSPVRDALRNLLNEMRIARVTRGAGRQFEAIRERKGMRVHLGCGRDVRPGWVNIDLRTKGGAPPLDQPGTVFINHDLRAGLPLAEGSCEYIYSSHFFEHLTLQEGTALMRDCRRALVTGGVFRAALPDLPRIFAAYLQKDAEFLSLLNLPGVRTDLDSGIESLVDFVNYGVYQFGQHKHIYDPEKLTGLLRKLGFSEARESEYQPGMDPDSELRRRYSFYVEAVH